MKKEMDAFLEEKQLSVNSRLAYSYDLEQFLAQVGEKITENHLKLYQVYLHDLKPSAQKRKLSTVNQFLYYLYQNGFVDRFHRLKLEKSIEHLSRKEVELLDLSNLWRGESSLGKVLALLVVELGLLSSEIASLRVDQIHLDFQIMTVGKSGKKRILELSDELTEELSPYMVGEYLFENRGKPYSRQWVFRHLEAFLSEKGQGQLSAQKLREQHILQQIHDGVDLHVIAKNLGLKSIVTLEKYK